MQAENQLSGFALLYLTYDLLLYLAFTFHKTCSDRAILNHKPLGVIASSAIGEMTGYKMTTIAFFYCEVI